MTALTYRLGTVADAPEVHQLSKACGWPYTLNDFQRFLGLAKDIRVCAVTNAGGNESGRIVGFGMCTTFPAVGDGSAAGLIGAMLTHPDQRKQGIGATIFNELVQASLERNEVPRLVATDLGSRVYLKNGFVKTEGYVLKRFSCNSETLKKVVDAEPQSGENRERGVRVAPTNDPAAFVQLDREFYGADRTELFGRLLKDGAVGDGKCTELVALEDGNSTPVGYAFVRFLEEKRSVDMGPFAGETMGTILCLLKSAAKLHVKDAETFWLWVRAETEFGAGLVGYLREAGFEERASVSDMIQEDFKRYDKQRKDTYVGLISPSWG